MKALVTYISWTGNTKKIAEAVFQGINTEKSIGTFDEVFDISSYDIVFVGFPIHGFGQPAAEAVRYLKERCSGKKVALFVTHAAPEVSSYVPPWLENCKEAAKETLFLGLFNCQGQISPRKLEEMMQLTDPEAREIARNVSRSSFGQPNSERLDRAKAFAADIIANSI